MTAHPRRQDDRVTNGRAAAAQLAEILAAAFDGSFGERLRIEALLDAVERGPRR